MTRRRVFKTNIIILGAVVATAVVAAISLPAIRSTADTLPRDCDATSIIYCGSLTVDELKADYASRDGGKYPDIPGVYSSFGISENDVNTISSTRGVVKADGTVWIGDKLIGKNAVTAGRVEKPGSVAIPGTSAYRRPPSASFASPSTAIDAFIGYKNGVPAFAILSSCGNPVTWETPAVPTVEIVKTIRSADNTKWVEDDTFLNDSTLTYNITLKNTSKADDTNMVIKDTLPANHTFVAGSVKVNNAAVGAETDNIISSGYKLDKIVAGQTIEITFQAKVAVPAEKCGDTVFSNKATVTTDISGSKEDTAGGKISIPCAVAIRCVSLTSSSASAKVGDAITYTAKSELSNATLASYEFRVNDAPAQNTTSNTFIFRPTQEGTYTIKTIVKTSKGDDTNANCESVITIGTQPVVLGKTTAVTTAPPTTVLPNTGDGGAVLAFLGISSLGTYLYRLKLLRGSRS